MSQQQKKNLFAIMGYIIHDLRYYCDKQFAKYDLSRKEWQILAFLRDHPNGLSQKWAKLYIGVEPSYFTKMLNDLEDGNFIIREIDKKDRRNRIIKIKPESAAKVKMIHDVMDNVNQVIQADLSKTESNQMFEFLDLVQHDLHDFIEEK